MPKIQITDGKGLEEVPGSGVVISSNVTSNGLLSAAGGLGILYPNGASAKTADFTAAAGYVYLVTKLDGCDVTLPTPKIGDRIKIIFGAVTSNAHTITADATSTLLQGYALIQDVADGTVAQMAVFAPDETNDDAMSMNGTTTGSSGVVELIGTATNRWWVSAHFQGSGTVATPFA